MPKPVTYAVLDDGDLYVSRETADRLAASCQSTSERLLGDSVRVVIVDEDEMRSLGADAPTYSAGEIASSVRVGVDAVLAQFEALGSLDKAVIVDRDSLPRGPSLKPHAPPPMRTGIREAARRRRQMEKRAARAARSAHA